MVRDECPSPNGVGHSSVYCVDDELFTTEMAYDPAGRVTTIHHHHDVSGVPVTLARFDYTVDARGNRTQAVEQRQPSGGGLVYLRARYLAPSLGTFASRDPWRGSASAPRTWE